MIKRVVQIGLLLAVSAALNSAAAQARDGKTAYGEVCRKCHGAAGVPAKAMAGKFPKLVPFPATLTADAVKTAITKGLSKDMVAFVGTGTGKVTADEVDAVVAYVLTLKAK